MSGLRHVWMLVFMVVLPGCSWEPSGSSLAARERFTLAERTVAGTPASRLMDVFPENGIFGTSDTASGKHWEVEKLQCFKNGNGNAEEINCRMESAGRKIALTQEDSSLMYRILNANDAVSTSAAGSSIGTAYEVSCLDPANPQADRVCRFKVVVKT